MLKLNSDRSLKLLVKFIEFFLFSVVEFGNKVILVLVIFIIEELLEIKCYDLDDWRLL